MMLFISDVVQPLHFSQQCSVAQLCLIVCDSMDCNPPGSYIHAILVAQMVKCLPTMWEIWVRSIGREDPLEKEMATHSSILAWKIPWTEDPGRLQSKGSQSRTRLSDFTFTFHWSGLPFPSSGDLPNPDIEALCLLYCQADSLPSEPISNIALFLVSKLQKKDTVTVLKEIISS